MIEYMIVYVTRVLYDQTVLGLALDSISLKCLKNMKNIYPDENNIVLNENTVEGKPCINRESKSDELTIQLYSCHDINMKLLVVVTPPSIYQFLYNTNILISKQLFDTLTMKGIETEKKVYLCYHFSQNQHPPYNKLIPTIMITFNKMNASHFHNKTTIQLSIQRGETLPRNFSSQK